MILGFISCVFAINASARSIRQCMELKHPGLYTLKRNLSAKGNCLIVKANHVTIDLNGQLISGIGKTGVGISATSSMGLHVRNGTITGFESGIIAPDFSTLYDMTIYNNGRFSGNGYGAKLGNGARVMRSQFIGNYDTALVTGEGAAVKDNSFVRNHTHLDVDSGSLVVNNLGIDASGVTFKIGGGALVMANNVADTAADGMIVGPNSNIVFNNAFGSVGYYDLASGRDTNVIGNAVGLYQGVIPGCDYTVRNCREFLNFLIYTD